MPKIAVCGGCAFAELSLMRVTRLLLTVALCALAQHALAAKRDIKGIATGMTMEDAIAAGKAHGGDCNVRPVPPTFIGQDFACSFNDGSFMDVMVTKLAKPNRVYRIKLDFKIKDSSPASKSRYEIYLSNLYSLRGKGNGNADIPSGEEFRFSWYRNGIMPNDGIMVIINGQLEKAEAAARSGDQQNGPKL